MREPLLICATGKKGVGKSYQHNLMMQGYVMGDPYRGIRPRKCLIMDVNDEYDPVDVFNVKDAFILLSVKRVLIVSNNVYAL
jgi:hypothetical protein